MITRYGGTEQQIDAEFMRKWNEEAQSERVAGLSLAVKALSRQGYHEAALLGLRKLIHYKIDNGYYGGKNIPKVHRETW